MPPGLRGFSVLGDCQIVAMTTIDILSTCHCIDHLADVGRGTQMTSLSRSSVMAEAFQKTLASNHSDVLAQERDWA